MTTRTSTRAPRRWAAKVVLAITTFVAALPVATAVSVAVPDRAEAATYQYSFGYVPYQDVLTAAAKYASCGLTQMELAALVVAPSYPETGASGMSAPSPMTLSRWDNQDALYAFANKATPYRNAFWHPGVGIWAFDSAGYWDLTAAEAMYTDIAADQTAATIASRWCSYTGNPDDVAAHRTFAWKPWHGCDASRCEPIYAAIYDPEGLRLNLDHSVTRLGGVEVRSCRIPGVGTFRCDYADPAKAQGYKGFAVPAFGPSPVSAPFYDIRMGALERRVWLASDTGYSVTVTATKKVTLNARTLGANPAITWSTGELLCDVTTGAGNCDWTGWRGAGGSWATTPTVEMNADGRLEMFVAKADGRVFRSVQSGPDGAWSQFVAMGGPGKPVTELAAARNGDGRLEVFALASDGTLSHSYQELVGSNWSAWYDMGGGLGRDLKVGVSGNGSLQVFGLDPTGHVVRRYLQDVGGWSDWQSLGGQIASRLNLARNSDGRLEVYVIDSAGALRSNWQRSVDGPFGAWLNWGGRYVGQPAVATNADGRLEVFLREKSGTLVHSWQLAPNSSWSPMFTMGSSLAGDPFVATNPDGRLEVFAKRTDGLLAHSWQDGSLTGWSGWLEFEGMTPVGTVATNSANGRIVLAALGSDGAVYVNTQLLL